MNKKQARLRRAKRARIQIKHSEVHRLSVHRTPRHIYAQILAPGDAHVVAAASTLDKQLRVDLSYGGNAAAAAAVGKAIAERGRAAGVERVAFDRSGFKYHGRIKALADAARENGLQF
ncbi:MAG: 50S ribosomal protein L18 [Gammaproteobacteria bacterium]